MSGSYSNVQIYSTADMYYRSCCTIAIGIDGANAVTVAGIYSKADRRRQAYSDTARFYEVLIGVTVDRGYNLTLIDIRWADGGSGAYGNERSEWTDAERGHHAPCHPGPLGPGAAPVNYSNYLLLAIEAQRRQQQTAVRPYTWRVAKRSA